MSDQEQKAKLLQKLKYKYRFAIFDEQTYEELWRLRLSRMNVIGFFGTLSIVIVIAVTLLIAYTPLREYIPGYPSSLERLTIVRNSQRVDSLIAEIQKRDRFVFILKNIITERNLDSSTVEKYKRAKLS